jgi:hypothetical protein
MRLAGFVAVLIALGVASWAWTAESEGPVLAKLSPENGTPTEMHSRTPLAMFSADEKRIFKKTDPLTRAFMAGAVKGLVYYSTMAIMEGKPALFCLPDGGLSIDEFWGLAAEVLSGTHKQDIIVITGLDQLQKKYPCEAHPVSTD